MKLLFTPEALASYNELKAKQPQEAEQVKDMLKDILAHPLEGKGDPQPLTGVLSGLWGRSYGVFRQLVYSFSGDEVKIYGLGKNLLAGMTPSTEVKQTDYTEDEYRSVLAQMEANRGKGETPKVGIFWYSEGRDELFGVVSHPVDDYSRANASDGRITCSELHEDVWKKEFYRQRYKGDGTGLFKGQYQDKPRGRVFYHIDDDTFEVAFPGLAMRSLILYSRCQEMLLLQSELMRGWRA